MNIAVCVKQVIDTEAVIELDGSGNVVTEGQTLIIDPYGEFAVEKAVQLKEALGGEVCCVCVGDEGSTSALRHALAMGADRAILVEDGAWRDLDAAQCAAELACVLSELDADVIMGGWTSGDTASAQVMGRIAQRLGLPLANMAVSLEAQDAGVRATCEVADGVEVADYACPVVVAAQQGLAEPRYPSVRDVMQARRKPIERRALAGNTQAAARVVSRSLKPARSGGRVLEGDAAQAVLELVRLLQTEAKVI